VLQEEIINTLNWRHSNQDVVHRWQTTTQNIYKLPWLEERVKFAASQSRKGSATEPLLGWHLPQVKEAGGPGTDEVCASMLLRHR